MLPNVGLMRFPKNTANRSALVVKSLFVNGERGAWFDRSDFSTLFQDAAGTSPVTAVGQPVGLMLDKRLGLGLGAELRSGGIIGIAGTATPATYNTTTGIGSVSRTDSANQSFVQWNGIPNTAIFRITNTGTNPFVIRSGSATNTVWITITSGQSVIAYVPSANAGLVTICAQLNGTTATFTVVSIKRLDGNHATQATTANRPIVGAGYDTYNGTNSHIDSATGGGGTSAFFLCMAITPTGGAGTLRTIWSDAGTNTGYKVQIDVANKLSFSAGNGTAYTTLASTAAINVGTTPILTIWDDGTNLNVQINSAAVESVARPIVSAGTAGFTMGADNGGLASFFSGNMYPSIYLSNANPTASQRAMIQAYCRSKAGL